MSKLEIQNTIVSYLMTFNPDFIGLFGSFSRNEKHFNDIDILVKFKKSLSLLQLVRIEHELSEQIGCKVDLVTEGALKNKRVVDRIYNDLKVIYEA